MSCGAEERRKIRYTSIDHSLTRKMRKEGQVKRCPAGHLNGKNASVCWKCGKPLKKGRFSMRPNKIIASFYFKHAEICDCNECKNKRKGKNDT